VYNIYLLAELSIPFEILILIAREEFTAGLLALLVSPLPAVKCNYTKLQTK